MKKIYKYLINLEKRTNLIRINKGANILCAGKDPYNNYCIWAEVDPEEKMGSRIINVCWTGDSIDTEDGKYIGTIVNDLVYHIYDFGEI
jgi:hypothetical protein